jgi:hypothetical protein
MPLQEYEFSGNADGLDKEEGAGVLTTARRRERLAGWSENSSQGLQALLSRSDPCFSTAFWRHYDARGSLRTGSALGESLRLCCSNLSHVSYNRSDLVYIRTDCYESRTVRSADLGQTLTRRIWHVDGKNNPVVNMSSLGYSASSFWDSMDV